MAQRAVLGSYELLEQILLHLPLRDLLLSQKINKACFDVVQQSPDIHRALFWKACSGTVRWVKDRKKRQASPQVLRQQRCGEGPGNHQPFHRGGMKRKSLDSREKIFLTQPALYHLEVISGLKQSPKKEFRSESGLTQGDLQDYGPEAWQRMEEQANKVLCGQMDATKVPPMAHMIPGATTWYRLAGTIDDVSGHEMLRILQADRNSLWNELMWDVGGYCEALESAYDSDSGDSSDYDDFDSDDFDDASGLLSEEGVEDDGE